MTDKWVIRFLALAQHVASWSKDPRAKVGAVIVDAEKRIVSLGYNGFPRGVKDDEERLRDKATKLRLVVHAEANAILNAHRIPDQCTLYTTQVPCDECAKLIIQAGIKTVVSLDEDAEKWATAIEVLREARVTVNLVAAP